jgi:hypothetical protein
MKLEITVRPIDDLILLPGNPRHGDIGAISLSLERFGQMKPIVVDDKNVILAGNHTFLAAKALGWTEIATVTADQLQGAEKSAFALADNRLSDLATYDDDLLLDMATHIRDETGSLDGTGYDQDDLDALYDDLHRRPLGVQGVTPPPPSTINLGDEFELGDHLLICGDATDPKYGRAHDLMFADPPYNVGITYGAGTDDTRDDYEEWTQTWWDAMDSPRAIITVGWHGLPMAYKLWDVLHTGVWLKRNAGSPSPVSMFSYWEPLIFLGSGFKTVPMRADDVFTFPVTAGGREKDHPVPKPMALLIELIECYTKPGDTVFDPFGGSGTTLIAAQRTGRKCVMLELEPGYCDGIIRRFKSEVEDV